MRKILFRFSIAALALIVTLAVLGYAFVDWQGARAWAAEEARLQAAGEPLTTAEVLAKPIPDSVNFAAAPIFAELFTKPSEETRLGAVAAFAGGYEKKFSSVVNAARTVKTGFIGTDAAAANIVLAAAKDDQKVWNEVRLANLRPGTRWQVDFSDGFPLAFDWISIPLRLGQSLQAQSEARLVAGNPSGALADVMLLLDLADRNREPPVSIAQLVRLSMMMMALEQIHSGIDRMAWDEEELARLQDRLGQIDLLVDLRKVLRGERAVGIATFMKVREEGLGTLLQESPNADETEPWWVAWIWNSLPDGSILNGAASFAQMYQQVIDALDRPEKLPNSIKELEEDAARARRGFIGFTAAPLVATAVPAMAGVVTRTMYCQAFVDMGVVACALARHQLREETLSKDLEALVPEFLAEPVVDVMSGNALHFRREGEREFSLWSVGWNQRDDGGSREPLMPKASWNIEDWVWGDW